ncbi:MAG: glycosyltransferase [Candidatus Methanofastidiosum sp.]|nr:glycosyltransferase [Methanofastidiosum sp.]
MSKKMFYIANSSFPSNTAYATRIYYLCKIYEYLGYEITVISTEGENGNISWLDKDSIRIETFFPKITGWKMNLKNLIFGGKELKRTLLTLSDEKPDVVIMGGGYTRLFKTVKDFCNESSAKLIIEVCEWFNASQFHLGCFGPFYWDNRIALRLLYKKADAIITISSYLEEYYKKFNIKTVRIPTILDSDYIKEVSDSKFDNNKLNIVYAGFIGKKKDMLDVVIKALMEEPGLQKHIHLHIIGPSEETIRSQLGISRASYNYLKSCITVYGPLSREVSLEYVAKADFTILIRPDTLNARAGFPTKVAESMLQGTPVIANLTSDIGLYLKDMETGIVVYGNTVNDVIDGLRKAIALDYPSIQNMRSKCRTVAKKNFDYRCYIEKIRDLLNSINVN